MAVAGAADGGSMRGKRVATSAGLAEVAPVVAVDTAKSGTLAPSYDSVL